jgi:hypothetical protein
MSEPFSLNSFYQKLFFIFCHQKLFFSHFIVTKKCEGKMCMKIMISHIYIKRRKKQRKEEKDNKHNNRLN